MAGEQSNDARTKARAFLDMHKPGDPVILANAWDIGSARMLQSLGAKAVGTSSAAFAFTLGKTDNGEVTRGEALGHAAAMAAGVSAPVSADLENGYGPSPDDVRQTILGAIESGAAGASIEDFDSRSSEACPFAVAVERIEAAIDAIKTAGADFVLTARADGVIHGAYDLAEAIRRIQAFEAAGAPVVFVPGPSGMADVAEICGSVSCPVNALCSGSFRTQTRDEFAAAGVARISIGSGFARAVHKTLHDAAMEVFDEGRFTRLQDAIDSRLADRLIAG